MTLPSSIGVAAVLDRLERSGVRLIRRGGAAFEEIPVEGIETGIARVAGVRGFAVPGDTVEIEGRCPRCRR